MEKWLKDSDVFFEDFEDKFSLGYQIHKRPEAIIPAAKSCVIIGIDSMISDSIRRELYKTSYPFDNIYLADLGNLVNHDPKYFIALLKGMLSKNINVILLGLETSHIAVQLKSLQDYTGNIAFIEKAGDIFFSPEIQDIFFNRDHILKAKLIGYQTHLLNPDKLKHKMFNQSLRLGKFRNNYREAEPVLRNVEWALFNMDSIRYSEVPGIKNTSPSGLTSEESCQIMKYLGINNKTNIVNIYGYNPKYDFHGQGAMMVSQLIWYYLEGLEQQIFDNVEDKKSINTYIVDLEDYNISLDFHQSRKTGRWWVKIPVPGTGNHYVLPCSEDDYDKATKGELSYRLFSELGL